MPSPLDKLDEYAYPAQPELLIGLVAPIGAPTALVHAALSKVLVSRHYDVGVKKLSDLVARLAPSHTLSKLPQFDRYNELMTLGNRLREKTCDDVLSLYIATDISSERPENEPRALRASAFIIHQLKRPEEVYRLRKIYGDHFLLIGLYCPKHVRREVLINRGMTEEQANLLIARDEDEADKHGQRVRETFHLADVFIRARGGSDGKDRHRIDAELRRFIDLVFGEGIMSPTRDEFGIYMAYAAGLRSSSLSRQVGASLLTAESEVIAVGANEVPCYPSGLYWGDEKAKDGSSRDARDDKLGYDPSDLMKREIISEILPHIDGDWTVLNEDSRKARVEDALVRLKGTRVTSLTEFARPVHAELEAILSAGRVGTPTRGTDLFCTTFPCHVCAKHIVASGVRRVVYIEPYPKSLAVKLYGDSLEVQGEDPPDPNLPKVCFEPFVGVAPRRYHELFGRSNYEGRRIEYKDSLGQLSPTGGGLRIPFTPLSYVVRESLAAEQLRLFRGAIDALEHGATSATGTAGNQ